MKWNCSRLRVLLQLDAIIVAQRESDGNSPPPVMAPPAPAAGVQRPRTLGNCRRPGPACVPLKKGRRNAKAVSA